MRMKMILKRKELKMNEETPQGGDDRQNWCLGKLMTGKTAPKVSAVASHCTKVPMHRTKSTGTAVRKGSHKKLYFYVDFPENFPKHEEIICLQLSNCIIKVLHYQSRNYRFSSLIFHERYVAMYDMRDMFMFISFCIYVPLWLLIDLFTH